NTRLLNELRQSLQQQTATADVLKVISRSTFDLKSVLNTLVESAARLCEADMASIPRRTGAIFDHVATYGYTPDFHKFLQRNPIAPGRGTGTGRAVLEGKTIHIPDVLADSEYTFLEGQKVGEYRTSLYVPLMREGAAIGVLVIARRAVRPFTDQQIELAETFADQAGIAIENVRLFEAEQQRTRELTESLEQQTATPEVLKVISGSPGDLQPVFDAMLANATRLCEAKFGTLQLRESDNTFRVAAMHNPPAVYAEARRRNPLIYPSAHSALGRVIATKQLVHIADYTQDVAYKQRDPLAVSIVELAGARTLIIIPMLKEGELIGNLLLYRQEVRPFTEKQIALLTNFAAQAVIAIENARLLNELRESLQQQTATSEVLKVISSAAGELKPVFDAILENATRICEAAFGSMLLCEGDAYRRATVHNAPPEFQKYSDSTPIVRRGTAPAVDRVADTGQVSHILDVASENPNEPIAKFAGARTLLVVPMLKDNEPIGMLGIYRQEVRPFTEKQIALVQNFASQAVIAIENARLLNELRESLNQQTATSEVLQVISSSPG